MYKFLDYSMQYRQTERMIPIAEKFITQWWVTLKFPSMLPTFIKNAFYCLNLRTQISDLSKNNPAGRPL